MSSAEPRPTESASAFGYFGLRLGLWYATLFVFGAIAIVFLTYYLTATSLTARDSQIIEQKLGEYAAVYARGGPRALANIVTAEQRTAPERLFVRIVGGGADTLILSSGEGWQDTTLEVRARELPDGSIIQVGKSTEARLDLLSRFRATLGLVTLSIVMLALSGGWIATHSAIQPLKRLGAVVRRIIDTGRTDERLPIAEHDDAIGELTGLFNAMLDRIQTLVNGMRGALDNVSHDLRTPLTRLRGTAEMALAAPPDVERYREALADCVEESDRVLTMLNTLMDISEAESGAMPLNKESVDLREVAERAVDLYHDVADAKGVVLRVTDGTPTAVSGDRVRLEQVAANLIDNAIKYSGRGGEVHVSVDGDQASARLVIRDSGAGIPADELPRIWERLFRGDRSRAERGLGLGLSLVKAVVEAHRGEVSVASSPGKGSTFTISLPRA
jgi:signal transduction histidine kinase